MKPSTLDTLIWVFIYGGLLGVGLGLSVARSDMAVGCTIAVAGGIATAVGVVMVLLRSRMSDKVAEKTADGA
jgi:hypothetical protein